MIFTTMLLSAGCEKKTAATESHWLKAHLEAQRSWRRQILVGYDGKMLRKSVDHIKEANEKHNQDMEKMAGSGPDQ